MLHEKRWLRYLIRYYLIRYYLIRYLSG